MLKDKIKTLPKSPGVYLFKNEFNEIIYVGKAKCLRSRVASYFVEHAMDLKTQLLQEEMRDIDHIITTNEEEALLLEAQLIQDKKPEYNLLLKNGQPFIYFLFTNEALPKIKLVRNKKEKGSYFGPFLRKKEVRGAYDFMLRAFQLKLCNQKIPSGCLNYHMNTCAGTCKDQFNLSDYLARLELVKKILTDNCATLHEDIWKQINEFNKTQEFERAKALYDYLKRIDHVIEVIKTHYCETKYAKDIALISSKMSQQKLHPDFWGTRLKEFLKLETEPKTIDCFDISHFQSQYIVGSCVRFNNGVPEKNKFRKFKIKTLSIQNDYAALQEIVQRRYRDANDLPDLVLIDGGKGQLNAVKNFFPQTTFVSLAKREEILFTPMNPDGIRLDVQTEQGKLLIALRDYAHHFAINYHRQRSKKENKEKYFV